MDGNATTATKQITMYCKHCREHRSDCECDSDDTSRFVTSLVIGAATGSALLGGLLGGDIVGGVVGDLLDGDLFD